MSLGAAVIRRLELGWGTHFYGGSTTRLQVGAGCWWEAPIPVCMSSFTGLLEFPHAPSRVNNLRELGKNCNYLL